MLVIYRTSLATKQNEKLPLGTNLFCFFNFLKSFSNHKDNIKLIICFDNYSKDVSLFEELIDFFKYKNVFIYFTFLGNSGSFKFCYDMALKDKEEEFCYFLEDDYVHCGNDCFSDIYSVLNNDLVKFCTLFDHPDKYTFMYNNGEICKVIKNNGSLWKNTISTTMTFASSMKSLSENKNLFYYFCESPTPNDHAIFSNLNQNKQFLYSRIPGSCFTTDFKIYPKIKEEKTLLNTLLLDSLELIKIKSNDSSIDIINGIDDSDYLKKLTVLKIFVEKNNFLR